MVSCEDCKKEYKQSTLDKYGGSCGKCFKKSGKGIVNSRILRLKVWEKYFGNIDMKCPICNTVDINPLTFELGHDIADSLKGKKTLENLAPICRTCNINQGTLTFKEFKKTLPRTKLEFKNITYDQRRCLIKKWCVDSKHKRLNDDKIHNISNNYGLFTNFSNKFDYNYVRVKMILGVTFMKKIKNK